MVEGNAVQWPVASRPVQTPGLADHYCQNAERVGTASKSCTLDLFAECDCEPERESECDLRIAQMSHSDSRSEDLRTILSAISMGSNPAQTTHSAMNPQVADSNLPVIGCGTSMAHLSLIPQAVHCNAAGLWRRCRRHQWAASESIH